MQIIGTAVKGGERTPFSQRTQKTYRIAFLEVRDDTLGLCEVVRFLNDGDKSPFENVAPGAQVAIPCVGVEVYKHFVTATVAPSWSS